MNVWRPVENVEAPPAWAVALFDDRGAMQRVHPIGFEDQREAARAASRLNARYQTPVPVNPPHAHMDEH